MPRKKKTIIEENLPDETPQGAGAGDDITDFLVVLTKVYKLNGATRSFCFVATEPVDEVLIQNQYPAGGKFIAVEYNAMNEVVRTTPIDIEPKPLTNVPATINGNGELAMLREELSFQRNMVTQMINGLFQSKINGNGDQLSMLEMVQVMQGLKDLGGKGGSSPVDLLIKGMELGAKTNGGGDWKTDLIATAKEVLPPIANSIAQARQPQGTTRMIQTTTTPADVLKQGIAWIKTKILTGMQPDLAVGMLVQFANDPQYQPILATAIQGDINTFISIDPEIANEPYRSWFTVAIEELKGWYAEQSTTENDNERGNGDSADVAGNANTGTRKPKIEKVS